MLFTGYFVDYALAGVVAGLVLLASHYVFKQVDIRPHVLINYVYGSLVWMTCATIALLQSSSQDIGTMAIGYWVVLIIAGTFDFLAYGFSHIGAINRAKRVKKEMKNERSLTV